MATFDDFIRSIRMRCFNTKLILLSVVLMMCAHSVLAENVRSLTDAEVCTLAVKGSNWEDRRYLKDYVYEANRRKIKCGLSKVPPRRPLGPIHAAFKSLLIPEREKLQERLASMNLYTGKIDGLFGKQTSKSLKSINEQIGDPFKLTKKDGAFELIQLILADTSVSIARIKEAVKEMRIADTLKIERKVESIDPLIEEPTEKQIEIKAPPVPLSAAQIKASYDAKEFAKAFTDAQVLAVKGDVDAQLLLGKMYADGRGTIQVTTAAHMWFNIASMGGNDEAYEQRKAVTAEMTPGAVEKAQAMAMTCIQSEYMDCGLAVKPLAKKAEPIPKAVTDLSLLKSHFKDQSPLKRKQIQYALKKLGVYSSSVDGSWGNRTAAAVSSYQKIQELQSATPSELYESVLSKVDVPSSFASSKKIVSKQKSTPKVKKESPQGYTRENATAICEPQAEIAGLNAARAYETANETLSCQEIGSFTSCRKVSPGGGFAGGFAFALNRSNARDDAKNAVMSSCMARYGWF